MIVKSGIDPGILHFVHEVTRAGEGVGGVRDQTVHGERDVWSPKVPRKDGRNRSGDAAVRCWIFRMAWGSAERKPSGVAGKGGIPSVSVDCRNRSPEAEVELRIPAAYGRICISRPEHRHQPGRV